MKQERDEKYVPLRRDDILVVEVRLCRLFCRLFDRFQTGVAHPVLSRALQGKSGKLDGFGAKLHPLIPNSSSRRPLSLHSRNHHLLSTRVLQLEVAQDHHGKLI